MTLDELMGAAAAKIDRLSPVEALAAAEDGALIVDIRSETSIARTGAIPGAIHVPRTVFEWRLEPDGEWRNPRVEGLDQRVIVICDEGFSSVLAAATLADLGYERPADVEGGFTAWAAADLPVDPS